MSKRKYHEFSKLLAIALIDNNTTQKELSEKTGVASCMISNYYRGFALPSGENLYKISKALNLDVEQTLETVTKERENARQ